jgi:hypothetical protein
MISFSPAIAIAKAIPLRAYVYGVIALTIVGLAWYADSQHDRAIKAETQFKNYRDDVVAAGKRAEREADEQRDRDKKRQERANEANERNTAALNRELIRLRANNATQMLLPPAPAGSSRPDLACFDRAEFIGAARKRGDRVLEIVGAGAKATVDLDDAKTWARP